MMTLTLGALLIQCPRSAARAEIAPHRPWSIHSRPPRKYCPTSVVRPIWRKWPDARANGPPDDSSLAQVCFRRRLPNNGQAATAVEHCVIESFNARYRLVQAEVLLQMLAAGLAHAPTDTGIARQADKRSGERIRVPGVHEEPRHPVHHRCVDGPNPGGHNRLRRSHGLQDSD